MASVAAAVAKQAKPPPGGGGGGGGGSMAGAPGGPFCEPWASKVARVRAASPHGHLPGWALVPVIVKSGDDCRQEHMAVQLVAALQAVFTEAGLPIWLRPFDVRGGVGGGRVEWGGVGGHGACSPARRR